MSATAQPGSSGGPVMDNNGLLVGVVRAVLHTNGPVIAQNVNFGINLASITSFLDAHGVDYDRAAPAPKAMSVRDITAQAQKSTVMVECD
jgi:S1-C subfamily serine protease